MGNGKDDDGKSKPKVVLVEMDRYQIAIAIFSFAIRHARISSLCKSGGDFNPYRASNALERKKKGGKRTMKGKVTRTAASSMEQSRFQSCFYTIYTMIIFCM